MSRPGPIKLMIKNWKTSIFFVPASSFALWYTHDYTTTNGIMKSSCRRAMAYGDEKLRNPTAPTRHITVILNPVAGNRKSKKLYEKWVEPLLHLAGIKVSLIETKSPNEAFELMKIMSNCDGVAIVGGDGTVHEAINGLLQRPDCLKATKDFPIGIIPTGQYNSIARYLHQGYLTYRNQKEFLIHSTIKLVDSTTTKFDTIKITPIDEELKPKDAPIYALRDIRYGLYQDNFFKVSGYYYYQTYIKPIWMRLQRTFGSKYSLPQINSVSFTEPCEGCTNCFERHKLRDELSFKEPEEHSSNRKWWSLMAPVSRSNGGPSEEERKELELSKRSNPDCGLWINVGSPGDISDFRACMMGDKMVRLSLGRKKEFKPSDVSETQDVRLILRPNINEKIEEASQSEAHNLDKDLNAANINTELKTSDDDKKKNEDKPVQFLIDGQTSPAQSVEITALSKAITVFTGPYKLFVPTKSKKKT